MNRNIKLVVGAGIAVLLFVVGVTAVRASAGIVEQKDVATTTTQLILVDVSDADEETVINLPPVAEHDRQMYIVKMHSTVQYPMAGVTIAPAMDEHIDMFSSNTTVTLWGGAQPMVTFIADAANNTWWMVSKSSDAN